MGGMAFAAKGVGVPDSEGNNMPVGKSVFGLVWGVLLMVLPFRSALANDWPQACYNEVSMWVTNACKEYIETVYYAAPGPEFGAGLTGLFLALIFGAVCWRRMRKPVR